MNKYYVVCSSILPEKLEKVIDVKKILNNGEAHGISDACKMVGISRGTYYKYKDSIFEFHDKEVRRATVSLTLTDEKGTLSSVLSLVGRLGANVLAINQTIPVNGIANVVMTLDISELRESMEEFVARLREVSFVKKAEWIAME